MKTAFALLFFLLAIVLVAQEPADDEQMGDTLNLNVDLFEQDPPLEMILSFNIKQYQRGKNEGEYVPVDLTLVVNDTLSIDKDVRIKARGQFRRNYCSLAPFWLNIRKTEIHNEYLEDVKKMKIVTQCMRSESFENYVLKEYLAYRIYNLLDPVSFRVRLIHMKYVDTGRKNKETRSWAFMIEPENMLADRFNALDIKNDNLGMVHMRPEEILKVALFMYMIGNADYSVAGRHNVKILGKEGFGQLGYSPVPYDFDYSGFVNASYAIPGENLGISSVRERYYLGPCASDADYLKVLAEFAEKEEEIRELLQSFPYLEDRDREEVLAYMDQFFRNAEDEEFILNELKATCRELSPQSGGAPGH